MSEVGQADLRAVLNAAHELAEIEDLDDLRRVAVRTLGTLVACDSLGWSEGDPRRRRWISLFDPPEAEPEPRGELDSCYWQYRHQHPVGSHRRRSGDQAPWRFSDLVSSSALRRTELYNLFLRPLSIEHQLSFAISLDTWKAVVGLNRSSCDFTERDRSVLALLQPAFVAAYRRARRRSALRLVGESLTMRETQILAWVASGKTNREIAQKLYISPRTVQKHLEHVFEKLGVRTRTEAAARWHGGYAPIRTDQPAAELSLLADPARRRSI